MTADTKGSFPDDSSAMPPAIGRAEVRTVACVGLGLIGTSWASVFLARGFAVCATDTEERAWQRALPVIEANMADLGKIGPVVAGWRKRLRFEPDLGAALQQADFVQENGPEQERLKVELFEKLDRLLAPDVIIASSTSGIPMSTIQKHCGHPERCIVGHPFTPAHIVPLVEIVGGAKTDPAALAWARAFYESLGKKVVHVRKDVPGFLANRFQTLVLQEALSLVENGVATVEEVDEAFVNGPGLRWALYGPFALTAFSAGEKGIGAALRRYKDHRENVLASIHPVEVDNALIDEIERQVGELPRLKDSCKALRDRDRKLLELRRHLGQHGSG